MRTYSRQLWHCVSKVSNWVVKKWKWRQMFQLKVRTLHCVACLSKWTIKIRWYRSWSTVHSWEIWPCSTPKTMYCKPYGSTRYLPSIKSEFYFIGPRQLIFHFRQVWRVCNYWMWCPILGRSLVRVTKTMKITIPNRILACPSIDWRVSFSSSVVWLCLTISCVKFTIPNHIVFYRFSLPRYRSYRTRLECDRRYFRPFHFPELTLPGFGDYG